MKKEMVGKRFGKWLVLEETSKRDKHHGTIKYLCLCDCGKRQIVNGYSLRKGISKYCITCRNIKTNKDGLRQKNKRINNIYNGIISRCYNKNNLYYKNYGGRGIKMCQEWLNSKISFYNWAISNGYNDNLTIDRIDNNGDYEPNNCRWATKIQQANNTTKNRLIEYDGKIKTLAEWARDLNMSQQRLKYRLDNWEVERALKK